MENEYPEDIETGNLEESLEVAFDEAKESNNVKEMKKIVVHALDMNYYQLAQYLNSQLV
jgi:hypothetical protein